MSKAALCFLLALAVLDLATKTQGADQVGWFVMSALWGLLALREWLRPEPATAKEDTSERR